MSATLLRTSSADGIGQTRMAHLMRLVRGALLLALLLMLMQVGAAYAQDGGGVSANRVCKSSTFLSGAATRAVNNEPALDRLGRTSAFWSTFDQPNDALQNTDGSIEIFTSARLTDTATNTEVFQLRQVTESPGSILGGFNIMPEIVTIIEDSRTFVVFASNADAATSPTPQLNNRDGNFEVFIAQTAPNTVPIVWQMTNLKTSAALLPSISEVLANRARLAFVSDADASEGSPQGPQGQDSDSRQRNFELYAVTVDFSAAAPRFLTKPVALTRTNAQIIIDQPSISADGLTIAFASNSNSAAGLRSTTAAPGPNREIFLARLTAATTPTLANFFQVTATAAAVDNARPDVSRLITAEGNATRVVFVSNAAQIGSAVNEGARQAVFAATVNATATALVAQNPFIVVSSTVPEPPGREIVARDPVIDYDGRRVVFAADGCDPLTPLCNANNPPVSQFQLYVADLKPDASGFFVARVTDPVNGVYRSFDAPALSGDGQFIAVVASQGNVVVNPDLSGSELRSLECPRASIGPVKDFVNVSGSLNPRKPDVGDTVDYTVTVANTSLADFSGTIIVTDTLPIGNVQFITAGVAAGSAGVTFLDPEPNANNRLRWSVTNLPQGSPASVVIRVQVLPAAAGKTVVNSVVISSTEAGDLVDSGVLIFSETTSRDFAVTQVDLRSSLSVSNRIPREQQEITYTISISNVAGLTQPVDPATNVRVTSTVLSGGAFTLVRATPTSGDYNPANGAWTIPQVVAGTPQRLAIVVVPNVGRGGTPPISAAVTGVASDQYDFSSSNNLPSGPVSVRVRGTDMESVSIRASNTITDRANISETVAVTLVVRNNGPLGGLNDAVYVGNRPSFVPGRVEVRSVLPPQVTFVSASSGAAVGPGNTVTWNFVPVAPINSSTSFTMTMRVRVNSSALPGQTIIVPLSSVRSFYPPVEGGAAFPDPVPANSVDNLRSATFRINDPASIVIPDPQVINEGDTLTVTVRYTDSDIADTHDIRVVWGDGSPDALVSDVVRPPGQLTNTVQFQHEYADNPPGGDIWNLLVSVTDSQGAVSASDPIEVIVNNVLPLPWNATITGPILQVGSTYIVSTTQPITVAVRFTDPGYTAFSTQETFEYVIDWGDGSATPPRSPEVVNNSPPGPSTGQARRSHLFTQTTLTPLLVQAKLRDDDSTFAENPIAFTFNVRVNNPPTAVNDTLAVLEKSDAGLNVLANDVDPNDTITLTRAITTGTIGQVTDVITVTGFITYGAFSGFDDLPEGGTRADSFQYVIVDSVGLTDTGRVDVTVTGVNDPPLLDLNGAGPTLTTTVQFIEDAGAVVVAPSGLITDVDSNIISATVELLGAVDGPLESLTTTVNAPGIVATWNDASKVLSLNGSASDAAYSTVLEAIVYTNTSESTVGGTRLVRVVARDSAGPLTPQLANVINITRVDDAPVIVLSDDTVQIDQSAGPTVIDPGVTIQDADSPILESGAMTVTVVGNPNPSKDEVSLIQGNGVTLAGASVLVDGNNVAQLTGNNTRQLRFSALTSLATLNNMNRVLRQVGYDRLPGRVTNPILVQWSVRSATSTPGSALSTITVAPFNYPPGIGLVPFTVVEDVPVNLEGSLSLSDPEVVNENVIFTATADVGTIVANQSNGLALTQVNPRTVRVVGQLSALNDDAGWNLVYTTPRNFDGTVNFTFSLDDAGVDPPPAKVTSVPYAAAVVPQPDVPVLDLLPGNPSFDVDVAYTEQAAPVVLASTLVITDIDNTQMASASVAISSPSPGGVEVLAVTPAGGIVTSFNAVSGVLSLSGSALTTDYVNTLRTVRYSNSSNSPEPVRTIRFSVTDPDGFTSNVPIATVNITALPDPPVLTISGTTLTVVEKAPAAPVDPAALVTDPDTMIFASGRLTVSVTAPVSNKDVLEIRTGAGPTFTLAAANTSLLYNNQQVATLTGYGTARLAFTLTPNVTTPALLTDLLRSITYRRLAGPSVVNRAILFELLETIAPPAATGQRPLAVNGDNDPPVVTVAPVSVIEDSATGIATSITVTDVDSANGILVFTATVGSGRLDFNTAAPPSGITYVSGDLTTRLVVNGNITNLIAMLQTANNLVYSPTLNFVGATALTVIVNDQGNTPNNIIGIGSANNTITVQAVNDPPVVDLDSTMVGINFGSSFTEGETNRPAVSNAAATVTDVDSPQLNEIRAVLTTRPDGASESLAATPSGSVVVSWDTTPNALILAGPATLAEMQTVLRTIVYNNNSENPTTGNRIINVTATDTSSAQSVVAVSTMAVSAVNDLPVIIGSNVMTVPTTTVSTPITTVIPVAALNATDVDTPATGVIYNVATVPAIGTVRLSGTLLTACPAAGSTFTQDDVNNNRVTFTHNSAAIATVNLVYRVANGALCTGATTSLEIRVRAP